ncbi:nuclear transport factor 2 family protein [Neptunicella sp. SCSIO 80796]|uniref:nuclear transport factor 2 family protein n=1 Tax=Neptunicella plasticusilytica TaxID=3117012 RepID=UPI003A4D7B03
MQVTDFFENYMKAFNAKDADKLAEQYYVPAIIMIGSEKLIFTDRAQVKDYVEQIIQQYQQQGIAKADIDVQNVMKLANNFIFCKIIWHFYDQQGQLKLECPTSYTMQMHNNDVTHIVAVVKDNDKPITDKQH